LKASSSSLARDTTNDLAEAVPSTQTGGRAPAAVVPASGRSAHSPDTRQRRSHRSVERPNGRSAGAEPFGPDVILPEQFYEPQNGLEHISGEKALMLAVLEDGIRCFQEHLKNPRVRPRLLARQAEKWIRSPDWDWPFSFNNVCESLALNPECLRARLLAPRENGEPTPKPRPSSHRVYRLTPRVKPPRRR
jgi:hypothetical protein